ncbi:hypothetical protein V9T40_011923 [Parthenolecanium corni]|uniref:dolichol kinase n=1 Tax=Parthenolecanium corni TaxID=536013 RepID=A0AAN9TJK0_9HEMI
MNLFSFTELNTQVRNRCLERGLIFRSAGNGLWMCLLLPVALLSNLHNYNGYSELYKTIAVVSIGQFICAVSNILQSNNDHIPFGPIGLLFSSTIVSLVLVFCTDHSLIIILTTAILSSLSYSKVWETVIRKCPRCFTYGEVSLIAQAIVLYLSSFGINLILLWSRYSIKQCHEIATFILQAGFFAVLCIVATATYFPAILRNSFTFLFVLCSLVGIFVLGLPFIVIERNSILWLFQLVNNQKSIPLISLWMVCCLGAVYFLSQQCRDSKPASSGMRKSFHFLIFIVFLPGLIIHPCLMYLASGVALALLILIETARKLNVTVYSNILHSCFKAFKDEKDEGDLALTPLYLMIGCAVPLWMYPFSFSKYIPLPVLAGLLTVAIGDSMASIGGTSFGSHQWPRSSKTIEGTICCFASQIITLFILFYLGFIRIKHSMLSLFTVAVISLLEAHTDQIDNLILPFVSYIMFCLIS